MNTNTSYQFKLATAVKHVGRFLKLLAQQFNRDHCTTATAALTYTSLLAVVPLLAVGLILFQKLPFYPAVLQATEDFILRVFTPGIGQQLVVSFAEFIAKAGQLTGISSLILLVTAMMTLNTIDQTLNKIWKVERGRRTAISMLIYFGVVVLGPLLVGLSVIATTYLLSLTVSAGVTHNSWQLWLAWLIILLVFSAVYRWVPNTHVKWRYALTGGLLATILFELAKQGFTLYLRWFPNYEIIYGAVAVVPLTLVWIYISWLVVLIGAETAHCLSIFANRDAVTGAQTDLLPTFHVIAAIYLAGPAGCAITTIRTQQELDSIQIKKIVTALHEEKLIVHLHDDVYRLSAQLVESGLDELQDLLRERGITGHISG